MEHREYNGWTNYETWLANLWIDNDQGEQERITEDAQTVLNEASEDAKSEDDARETATQTLAERMESEVDERIEEAGLSGLLADLLNAASSEINWREIAKHHISDATYTPPESDDDETENPDA